MKIVFTQTDGSTAIMTPAPQEHVAKVLPEVVGMSPQQYIDFIIARDVPKDATNISIVQDDQIPVDRTFRDGLKHDLTYDMQKCVDITNVRLRIERAPLLANLDVAIMKAVEIGADTATIAVEKQRLRDITKIANTDMSMDQLKAISVK